MSQITKKALEQALKNLLLKKPLNKITISNITDECGINRMTFYYHFKDIYDLVEWVCLEDAKKALEDKKTYSTWQEGFLNIFDAVKENKPFITNVYRCIDREHIEKYLAALTDGLLMSVIEEQAVGLTVRDEDKEFIAKVYSYVFVGIMLDWIKDDMKENPKVLIDKLDLAIRGTFREALERFAIGNLSNT
ncbi:MAG: TetR/AcrR family transcriptional regulator [Oscillospiraceae bacterium]|nr:TetR/AcrR family transcriptional regulator [Oscillospiraceae bacterium]